MQGLNPITMQCIYSTPCGYCTKWDKKCDKKIGCSNDKSHRGLRANANVYDEAITPCVSCEKRGVDIDHCCICWAHNFNLFKLKETDND